MYLCIPLFHLSQVLLLRAQKQLTGTHPSRSSLLIKRNTGTDPSRIWLRGVGVVFLLVRVSRGEMSLGVRIRVSSRPQHTKVLCFPHRHQ
ncbi:hypothetical protein Taro_017205 [Colocasia esculenta]|uniref:Uncharacterized protein n=1 Tax=Colocasia esculenta TaxID=4460 RepID=A0A843UVA6_COLES|nr:hypothetical protein [Colocasia esculenta]